MKIRIKKTKNIKEISAMGGGVVAGPAGPFIQKKKLDEDGPIAANTFGGSMKDRHLQSKDDQDTFDGQKERNAHNPNPNRAIDPQGKLLGEEEELEEGSMMGTVGTASEPDNGTYHEYGTGHDVGDWEYRDVMIRRAKRKLNRAYAPFISHQEMTAHINESSSFDDMDSVDREFFADRPTIGNDGSISKKPSSAVNDPAEVAQQSIEERGYSIEKVLGKGMNGTVYLASNRHKSKCAVKIVIGEAAERELNNYQTISDARSSNSLIEKHFPNVFEAWSPMKDVAIIAMEVLTPLSDAQASFVPDASFLHGKNKPWRLAAAGDVYSGMRDMSKRFTHYIQNNIQYVASRMEYFAHQLTNDWDGEYMGDMSAEKMAALSADVSPNELLDTMKMFEANPQMGKRFIANRKAAFSKNLGSGSSAVHLVEILEEESPESLGANAVFIQIAFKIMVAGLAAKQKPDRIDGAISDYAKSALGSARRFTQIPMGYNQPDLRRAGASHEREFLTSRGLHAAIVALHKQTGLMAKDLHDQNIMANAAGDLVIVDVGLFRSDNSWKGGNNLQEMLRIRKKMLRNLQK
ncbi:MAG: hypothetical protein ACPHX8_08145 [Candidatus Poseidoniaceae archaeon]